MIKKLLSSSIGIILGSFIGCTILMIKNDADFMRFWGSSGFIFFPLIILIFYLIAFGTYIFAIKQNLIRNHSTQKQFIVIGTLFSLEGILAGKLISKFIDFLTIDLINNYAYNFLQFSLALIIQVISFWLIIMFLNFVKAVVFGRNRENL